VFFFEGGPAMSVEVFTQLLPKCDVGPASLKWCPVWGSTPAGVTLTGTWVPANEQAEFSWPASTNPNLDHYVVRMSVGSSYDAATATVVGNFAAGTTSLATTVGLESPGDVASFKVFVVLTTGNEAGSNTVTITRP